MVNYVFTLENFEYFLLILVRVTCFVYVAPLLGQQGIPNQIKIGFSFFVSLLLYNVVDRPELTYASVVGYAVVVIKEGITGLLIGYAASICNSIVLFAGNIIDMDIGLSMSTEFNQDMGTETTLTGNLYYYLVLLLLITSDFYTYLVRAVTDSFSVIPIAHQKFAWDHLLSAITRYIGDSFICGATRAIIPSTQFKTIIQAKNGRKIRNPMMNMFSIGMQLKILVGFVVLYLIVFLLPNVANYIFDE